MIHIKQLDHVQICIPFGAEDEARAFYTDVLGFQEIEKPESLKANGGLSINKHGAVGKVVFNPEI
ncbi:hypothetical protein GsuE55_12880 [Geobacillus subterraneus]|uniref:Glyoxalase n=1 Tax=Geobacillus subterraneus TaxID=129338 RepID=A0A679FPC0_9BACL|nr:hypothetical protein B4113_2609 [Geobacillus sp. B4113_201601]BBW96455.1 hypothetical protein GsuE55_12880 [Geobacillus subterraneus]